MISERNTAHSLVELEWCYATLGKIDELIERNMFYGREMDNTRIYLLTARLWLKEAIAKQYGTRESEKVDPGPVRPEDSPGGQDAIG